VTVYSISIVVKHRTLAVINVFSCTYRVQVLDEILLRRTKTTRAEDIQLPPRIVRVRQERLDCRCAVYCYILVRGG
jgi:hypothetical protein